MLKHKQPPTGTGLADNHQSSTSSLRSLSSCGSEKGAFSTEVKQMFKRAIQLKKDLKQALETGTDQQSHSVHEYVGYISESAALLMESGSQENFKPAKIMLKNCLKVLEELVPEWLRYQQGYIFVVRNHLAQLANRVGQVDKSIEYLVSAIEAAQDPRTQNKDELPIVETYLNIANAHQFMGQHQAAIEFADKADVCASQKQLALQKKIAASNDEAERMTLAEMRESQINFKLMALKTKGQNYEKLDELGKAQKQYAQGKQLVEDVFGSDHEYYATFCSAMGGIKLKSKYPQVSNPQRNSRKPSPESGGKEKKRSAKKKRPSDLPDLQTLSCSDLSSSGRKPPRTTKNSLLESPQVKRSRLSMMESTLSTSYKSYRDQELRKIFRNTFQQQDRKKQQRKDDRSYLRKMKNHSVVAGQIKCTKGPSCYKHDWGSRSPIQKVCQKDKNCPNHDWSQVDRQDSPFKVKCKRGPKCLNHDWEKSRSPLKSTPGKASPTNICVEPRWKTEQKDLLAENERMYQQQVSQMQMLMIQEQTKTIEMILKYQNEKRCCTASPPPAYFMPPYMPPYPEQPFNFYGQPQPQTSSQKKQKPKKRQDSSESGNSEAKPCLECHKRMQSPAVQTQDQGTIHSPPQTQDQGTRHSPPPESPQIVDESKTQKQFTETDLNDRVVDTTPAATTTQPAALVLEKTQKLDSTFKSYHRPVEMPSRTEAALRIQNQYRLYKAKERYQQIAKAQKSVLLRTILSGKVVTCFVLTANKRIEMLKAQSGKVTEELSLTDYAVPFNSGVRDRLRSVIKKAAAVDAINATVRESIEYIINGDSLSYLNLNDKALFLADESVITSPKDKPQNAEVSGLDLLKNLQPTKEKDCSKEAPAFNSTLNKESYHSPPENNEESEHLARVIKLQALVRGFLVRCEVAAKRKSTLLFNSQVESQGRRWNCKLIKFSDTDYALTVRLAAHPSAYQMIRHFTELPFDDSESQQMVLKCLVIELQDKKWKSIDLQPPLSPIKQKPQATAQQEAETPTRVDNLLYLDIVRDGKQYRACVHRRNHTELPYQVKVWPMTDPSNVVKLNLPRLSRTSEGIREHLFYNLQVELDDCDEQGRPEGALKSIWFDQDLKTESSLVDLEETTAVVQESSAIGSLLLYLDIQRSEEQYRVEVYKRSKKGDPYTLKVTAEDGTEVTLQVDKLSHSSAGIRQHIWDHLQVQTEDGKLTGAHFSEEHQTRDDISEEICNPPERETVTAEPKKMLFLDITRNDHIFRVQVFKRKSKDDPYQLKVWNIQDFETVVQTRVQNLSRTSSGIRQHIWDHMQVTLEGDRLKDVYFTEDYVSNISPSVSAIEPTQPTMVETSPMLFLDITRNEQLFRVQVFRRENKDAPYRVKVWNIDTPDTFVTATVDTLSRTSAGIRQHIWDNLEVETKEGKLTAVSFAQEYHSRNDQSADTTKPESQKPAIEDERAILFLDILRDKQKYRVSVHRRKDTEHPYGLKVCNLLTPNKTVQLKMRKLSETSHGIRERIWYDLQVRLDENDQLTGVYFTGDTESQESPQHCRKLSEKKPLILMRGEPLTISDQVKEKNYVLTYSLRFFEPTIQLTLKNEITRKTLCVDREIPSDLITYAEVFDSQRGPARFKRLLTRVLTDNILAFKYQIPPDFEELMFSKLKNSTSMRSMVSSILLSSNPPQSSQLRQQESSSEYHESFDTTTKLRGVAINPVSSQMYMFTLLGDSRNEFYSLTLRNQTKQRYEFRDKPVLTPLFKLHEKTEAERQAKDKIIATLKLAEWTEDMFNEI